MQKPHHILIVDDEERLLIALRGLLETQDFKVSSASNGMEAVSLARKIVPDLIISDIIMPEMDGLELLKTVREDPVLDHIPVILLTAMADKDHRILGFETGAEDYLTKPFQARELFLKVRNLLTNREKLIKKQLTAPTKVAQLSEKEKFLIRFREILEANVSNSSLGLDDIAAHMCVSRSGLQKKVQKYAETSVTAFIREFRLKRAYDLLLQEVGNITDISYQTGFSSVSYFSRSFKDYYGIPPSEVRV